MAAAETCEDLAFVKGIPLEDEPGLGALTLPGFLQEIRDRYGPREALAMYLPDAETERWSYKQLSDRSVEVAKALVACGTGKDERIGILMTNRLEWVSGCFGISLAGGTIVGLSTFATTEELDQLIRESGISVLLFERMVAKKDFTAMLTGLDPQIASARPGELHCARFPFLRRLVCVDDPAEQGAIESWEGFLSRGQNVAMERVRARASSVQPSDPGMLLFSSGSTGKPKGVLSAHRGVCIQSWRWPRMYSIEEQHPVRFWSPNGLFWSGNWSLGLGGTLSGGGTVVLQRTFDPAESLRLFQEERVSLPYCWPHQWAQIEEQPGWADADLSNFWYIDAETMLRHPPQSIPRQRNDPRASYGSTETFTISTSFPVDTPEDIWKGTNGEVLPGNIAKIVDPASGETLRFGETGEFAVKGPTLMLGYIGVPPEEALDDQGFYHAGDGGFLDEQGRFTFQGRINDIIKTGGANVSPVEVDWTLCSCPGVKMCKTTGVPHETLGEMVISLVAREAGSALTDADVIAYLKPRLASYKLPRKVLFITGEDLDVTSTSKIRPDEARDLAARLLARDAEHANS